VIKSEIKTKKDLSCQQCQAVVALCSFLARLCANMKKRFIKLLCMKYLIHKSGGATFFFLFHIRSAETTPEQQMEDDDRHFRKDGDCPTTAWELTMRINLFHNDMKWHEKNCLITGWDRTLYVQTRWRIFPPKSSKWT